MYYWIEVENKNRKRNKILIGIALTIVAIAIMGFAAWGIFYSGKIKEAKMKEKEEYMLAKMNVDHGIYIKTKPLIPKISENFTENVKNIYHSPEEGKRVFLTFDDGPSKTVTPLILDLLKQENIKATFFQLGSRVVLNPDITKRVYEEGHYVANHGYSHVYSYIYQATATVLEEYYKTEDCIRNAIGNTEYHSNLFRFPGGATGGKYRDVKAEAKCVLEENGVASVDWNSLTADAAGKHTKEDMLEYVKSTIGEKKSVVILMHDASDKILTYEMLPDLIAYLREQGYEFKNFYDL